MMDRLDAMAVFVAAVESGSLSGAGRRLGMPLATVSRKLGDLEAHLKTRLLVRSTRSLKLTEAGEAYLRASRQILEAVNAAEREAGGEHLAPRGELTVSAPVLFGRLHVLPIVNAFLGRYPEVRVRLSLSDRNAHLIDDHVDVALRIGALPDSGLSARRVGSVRRVVCGAPDYFATAGEPRAPADLEAMACIAFDFLSGPAPWRFAAPGAAEFTLSLPRPRLSVNTAEAAVEAAAAGVGVTQVLSYQAAEQVAAGALRIVLKDFEVAPLPVSLVHVAQGATPMKVRAFLDMAGDRLRRVLVA